MVEYTPYNFAERIEDARYHELLWDLRPLAGLVGLMVDEGIASEKSYTAAVEALEPFLVAVEHVNEWPGSSLMPGETQQRNLYTPHETVFAILSAATDSAYRWEGPALPTDLHMLRLDRSVLFATVACTQDAWIVLSDDEYVDWMSRSDIRLVGE